MMDLMYQYSLAGCERPLLQAKFRELSDLQNVLNANNYGESSRVSCLSSARSRLQSGDDRPFLQLIQSHQMNQWMEQVLRGTSHVGHDSDCDPMSRAIVTKVMFVWNPKLWESYSRDKARIRSVRCCGGQRLDRIQMSTATERMQMSCGQALHWVKLDKDLNDIWAFHGTRSDRAKNISSTGFDTGRILHGYYGRGFYLAQESCKAYQYTDIGRFGEHANAQEGCIIVFRAVVGQPEYITAQDPSKMEPATGCDAVVVNPGEEGGPPLQQHQELCLFNKNQTHPEFIVYFRIPSEVEWEDMMRFPSLRTVAN
ncbi:unnamed protein product, partial [Prorocentrum cordatum]